MDGRQAQERKETAGQDYEHQADGVNIRSRIMNKYRRDFAADQTQRAASLRVSCTPSSLPPWLPSPSPDVYAPSS